MRTLPIILFIIFHTMAYSQSTEKILHSELCILDISTKEVTTVLKADYHFEAPNWTPDGKTLIFNSGGRLFRIPVKGGKARMIDTGFAGRCNNDHVLSPDGKQIAISHHTAEDHISRIYTLPVKGGVPQLVTPLGPSYLHGWSPVTNELAYCAERNGQYDVYTIDMETGEEKRLTDTPGLDDGPDYSPDGEYIYFNSLRTGTMQVWRMKTDGTEQTQMTFDVFHDWFPHVSPDNRWIVFLSYDPSVEGHPANKEVSLRRIPVTGGEPEVLLELFGGQGTLNVPSWSPNSKKFAFVRYEVGN